MKVLLLWAAKKICSHNVVVGATYPLQLARQQCCIATLLPCLIVDHLSVKVVVVIQIFSSLSVTMKWTNHSYKLKTANIMRSSFKENPHQISSNFFPCVHYIFFKINDKTLIFRLREVNQFFSEALWTSLKKLAFSHLQSVSL